MKVYLSIFAVLVLAACQNASTKTEQKATDSLPVATTTGASDPLGSELRAYGQNLIDEKIAPGDNKLTLACLDSLMSDEPESRDFFFDVYLIIADKAEAPAIIQLANETTVDYFEKYPLEAIGRYHALEKDDQQTIIESLAFEFYASGGNIEEDVQFFTKKISAQLSPEEAEQIQKLNTDIIREAKKMRNADNV